MKIKITCDDNIYYLLDDTGKYKGGIEAQASEATVKRWKRIFASWEKMQREMRDAIVVKKSKGNARNIDKEIPYKRLRSGFFQFLSKNCTKKTAKKDKVKWGSK